MVRNCITIVDYNAVSYELQILLPLRRNTSVDSKVEVLSTVKLQQSPDLYKIVDALNRTLKHQDLMFGLALDREDQEKAVFTIYRT